MTTKTLTVTRRTRSPAIRLPRACLNRDPVAPSLTAPGSLSVNAEGTVALGTARRRSTRAMLSPNITGVPADAMLSAGTKNNDGSWTLAELPGLSLTAGGVTTATFTVTATNTLGHTASTSKTIVLTVLPALAVSVSGTAQEGKTRAPS